MAASCDTCAYLEYDEDEDDYFCSVDMDEDDYGKLVDSKFKGCPYYLDNDEYKIVRHQM